MTDDLRYTVGTFRAAGLDARWTRTRRGAPIIAVREHGGSTWWIVDNALWTQMQETGVMDAFKSHTVLGDIFSIAV